MKNWKKHKKLKDGYDFIAIDRRHRQSNLKEKTQKIKEKQPPKIDFDIDDDDSMGYVK